MAEPKKVPESFSLYDANLTPEERLLHAILWRALKDVFCGTQTDKREAVAYVLSDLDEHVEWSFRWVCKQINLQPDKLVTHIFKFEEKLEESELFILLHNR